MHAIFIFFQVLVYKGIRVIYDMLTVHPFLYRFCLCTTESRPTHNTSFTFLYDKTYIILLSSQTMIYCLSIYEGQTLKLHLMLHVDIIVGLKSN